MAEVVAASLPDKSVPAVLKDGAWTKVFDSATTTPATAKTGVTAPTSHFAISRFTDNAFKVHYVMGTTTALHIIPQFSMDGTTWEDDGNESDVIAVIGLKLDFTATTVYTNSDGVVFRGAKVPFRFARFLVWVDGAIGAAVVKVYVMGASV